MSGDELSDEDMKIQQYWTYLALVLGFNELAIRAEDLEAKTYARLLRDQAEEMFIALGGHNVFTSDPGVAGIAIGPGMPHIIFREKDIELMRDTVHAYDVAKRVKP